MPAKVDEVKAAPLPARCGCGGCVEWERTEAQYQEDIECRTVTRRYEVAIGPMCGVPEAMAGPAR